MRIIICDDADTCQKEIKDIVRHWAVENSANVNITCLKSTDELIIYLKKGGAADLILLDMAFEGKAKEGLRVAAYIRKAGIGIPIIFITGNAHIAPDSYLVEAQGYVVKPIDSARLYYFLNKIYQKLSGGKQVRIDTPKGIVYVKSDDIAYIEAKNHTVVYYTNSEVLEMRTTLVGIVNSLDHKHFAQIHRSFLVSLKKILIVKVTYPHSVTVAVGMNARTLPIGRHYVNEFLHLYALNMAGQVQ